MIDILCNFFFLNLESGEEKNEKLIYWFARYFFNEYLQLIGWEKKKFYKYLMYMR